MQSHSSVDEHNLLYDVRLSCLLGVFYKCRFYSLAVTEMQEMCSKDCFCTEIVEIGLLIHEIFQKSSASAITATCLH